MGNGNNEARLPALVDAGITPELAALAHEINSPLEALLNLLFLLEREPKLTKKGQHYLDLAREEVRRALAPPLEDPAEVQPGSPAPKTTVFAPNDPKLCGY